MRATALFLLFTALAAQEAAPAKATIKLPAPKMGHVTLDKALKERKSSRNLTGPALSLDALSQLLWSAQGENRPAQGTRPAGRTVPSASARYPLEIYVAVAKSAQLAEGVYSYSAQDHSITKIKDGNPESFLGPMKPIADWILKAPAVFIISGATSRMRDYDNNPNARELYSFWESGAAAQSLCLQVAALGLGGTVVLSADLPGIKKALGMAEDERVSVIIPVGRVAK